MTYLKWGFSTDIQSMQAEINTNKTVKFTLGGLHSSSPTNSIMIKIEDLISVMKMFREIEDAGNTNDVVNCVKGKYN